MTPPNWLIKPTRRQLKQIAATPPPFYVFETVGRICVGVVDCRGCPTKPLCVQLDDVLVDHVNRRFNDVESARIRLNKDRFQRAYLRGLMVQEVARAIHASKAFHGGHT
jgi:hypothetical protein